MHEAPADFKLYKAQTTTHTLPLSDPHSSPPSNQIFSIHGAFKYTFSRSQAIASSLFFMCNNDYADYH